MGAFVSSIPDVSGHLLYNAASDGSEALLGYNRFGVSLITDSAMLAELHTKVNSVNPDSDIAKSVSFLSMYRGVAPSEGDSGVITKGQDDIPAGKVPVEIAVIYCPQAYNTWLNDQVIPEEDNGNGQK